jgi:uncharacterized protein (TIGR02594 family)
MSCTCQPPSSSRRIYLAALEHVGTRELPGKGSNLKIAQWIKEAADWLDGDDSKTAWCGCFRGHIGLVTGTGVPPEHYRAASWAKWGQAVDVTRPETWEQGDTIVMTRPGGNHVCLYHGRDPNNGGRIECLGGNQADSVNITTFPLSRITHVRRV